MSEITANGAVSADPSARYYVRDHHPENGTLLGFWIYLMSDCLLLTFGSIWRVTLMVQLGKHGLTPKNNRRMMCLSMFWHFLDVIWIGVFTFVYLMGALP